MKLHALCSLLVLISTTAVAQEANGSREGQVYVYRYKQAKGKGARPSLFCDGIDVARVQTGRYVALKVTPGKHEFHSNDKQSSIILDVKAGQKYFMRLDLYAGLMNTRGRLTLVLPEQGEGEVKKMKPIDNGMIKDKALLAADFVPTK